VLLQQCPLTSPLVTCACSPMCCCTLAAASCSRTVLGTHAGVAVYMHVPCRTSHCLRDQGAKEQR
jgi:hypothetical protein